MKFLLFSALCAVVVAAVFVACDTKKTEKTAETAPKPAERTAKPFPISKGFYQMWLHSREEDKDGTVVYRPADGSFSFPPSRGGRYGYVFEKDGKGSMTYPGPTDATEQKPMRWTLV